MGSFGMVSGLHPHMTRPLQLLCKLSLAAGQQSLQQGPLPLHRGPSPKTLHEHYPNTFRNHANPARLPQGSRLKPSWPMHAPGAGMQMHTPDGPGTQIYTTMWCILHLRR
jgi:hypothetical protein